MAGKLKLTLSCGDYEIIRALKEKAVDIEGVDLTVHPSIGDRSPQWRVASGTKFDICEFNVAAYFMMRDRDYEYSALPVHLHRRFRHGFVFVNTKSGIKKPSDLIGKKIASHGFIAAALVWLHGTLGEHYGLPHTKVTWVVTGEEDIPFDPPSDLTIVRKDRSNDVEEMLLSGEVDALIAPGFPLSFLNGDPRIARLFPDSVAEEKAYYKKTGIFPIMHTTMIKREIVEKHPEVVKPLVEAFERSKFMAYKRLANPRIVPLAFWSAALEEQNEMLGPDPWEYGMTDANRNNLQTILNYTMAQGLATRDWTLDQLFEDPGPIDIGETGVVTESY